MAQQQEDFRLLRRAEVERMLGISRSGLDDMVRDGHLPAPVKIGARAVRWRLSDLSAWIAARPSIKQAPRAGRE